MSSGFASSRRSSWRCFWDAWARCRSGSCSPAPVQPAWSRSVLLVYIAAAFLVAWAAVASDRHGIAWRFWPAQSTLARFTRPERLTRAKRPFRSPFDAQLSYEWGCHGLMLNGFVSVILFCDLGRLAFQTWAWHSDRLALIFTILTHRCRGDDRRVGNRVRPVRTVLEPSARACATEHVHRHPTDDVGAAGGRQIPDGGGECDRQLDAGGGRHDLLAGRYRITSTMPRSSHANSSAATPAGKGFAVIALTCILLPALSWRFLTGALVPVLTGRRWVADGAVWLYVSFLAALGGCGFWLAKSEPDQLARLYPAIPFLVAGIALVKGAVAVTGFHAALQRGLMSWRNIAGVLGLWFVLTACGIALAVLLGPNSSVPVSLPILALSVAALVPLARFPLATLALDWNRHR